MGIGYLLVSATTNDASQRTTDELQKFERQVLSNPDLRNILGIAEIKSWAELNPPRPVLYSLPSNRVELRVGLGLPVEPPVLIQKPGPVRSWYLGGDTIGSGQAQPASTSQTTQTGRKLPGWDQPLGTVRSLLNRLVSYQSPIPTEPDQSNTPPTEGITGTTSQTVPPLDSVTTNPAASGSNDLPIFRVLRWFVIRTQDGVSVEEVLSNLARVVQQENRQARRQRQIAPYLTLTIDTRTRLKTAGGGQPTSVPVRQEAIPEPGMKTDDYYTQEYFERIGLVAERDDKTHQLLKDAHNRPIFNVHNQAQGEGTVIVVLDTAPLPGQAAHPELGEMSAVDWSNIEAVIDLQPEFYTKPAQDENRQEKGKSTDYPPTPAHKGVKYHGMMVANLCKTVAPKSRIILVRALDDYGEGHTPSIIEFINFLVRRAPGRTYRELFGASVGPDLADQVWLPTSANLIFNLSLVLSGTKEEHVQSPTLLFAIDDATLKTPVFVCAAGNDSYLGVSFNPDEPAAYGYFAGYSQTDYRQMTTQTNEEPPSNGPLTYDPYNLVIGVASSAARARFLYASYSNASPLSAPSVEIKLDPGCNLHLADVERQNLVGPDGKTRQVFVYQDDEYVETGAKATSRYVCWSGTSFASPLVTGQVALLLGQREDGRRRTDPTEVKERIWTTAADPKWWNRPREINIAESL